MRRYLFYSRYSALAGLGLGLVLFAACGDHEPDSASEAAVVRVEESEPVRGASFLDVAPTSEPAESAAPEEGDKEPPKYTSWGSRMNPGLSPSLFADPGLTAGTTIPGLVTFEQLSLLGVNIDDLLDYIYKPDADGAQDFQFPEAVQKTAGDDRAFVGFMKTVRMNDRGAVDTFYLMRDLASCCFGGSARPDEWILVEMTEGNVTKLHQYVPVTVRGRFEIGIDREKDEYGVAIYKLKADSVERYQAPVALK